MIVGVDVGTSMTKADAYDDGRKVAFGRACVPPARALGDDDPQAWAAPARTVEPDPDAHACYAEGYLRYRAHVDTAREFWARQARGFQRDPSPGGPRH